mgnify:CR=1 FL=1
MSNITLNVHADLEDTHFKNEGEWMAKIIDGAHKNNSVEIVLREGVALEQIGFKGKKFLDILKDICETNGWPLTKFKFNVINLDQDKAVWPNITCTGYPGHFLYGQTQDVKIKKNIIKTFGMFVGRSSWDRLLIASHLHSHYPNITAQTYRNYLDQPSTMINMDFDRLLWQLSAAGSITKEILMQVSNFISKLPFTFDNKHAGVTNLQWDNGAWGKELLEQYNKIFVDVVCEKMITGRTFFPTEKTGRALATKTPIIVMSSPNYLANLRKLGFKTFKQYWNEDYDYQEGISRLESIKKVLDHIASKDVISMYQDMQSILDYNCNLYMELKESKIVNFPS